MPKQTDAKDKELASLNRLLVKVLRMLAENDREHEACMFAAEGWSLLRHTTPREAQRLDGLLHYLTAPNKRPGQSPEDQRESNEHSTHHGTRDPASQE